MVSRGNEDEHGRGNAPLPAIRKEGPQFEKRARNSKRGPAIRRSVGNSKRGRATSPSNSWITLRRWLFSLWTRIRHTRERPRSASALHGRDAGGTVGAGRFVDRFSQSRVLPGRVRELRADPVVVDRLLPDRGGAGDVRVAPQSAASDFGAHSRATDQLHRAATSRRGNRHRRGALRQRRRGDDRIGGGRRQRSGRRRDRHGRDHEHLHPHAHVPLSAGSFRPAFRTVRGGAFAGAHPHAHPRGRRGQFVRRVHVVSDGGSDFHRHGHDACVDFVAVDSRLHRRGDLHGVRGIRRQRRTARASAGNAHQRRALCCNRARSTTWAR